MRYSWDHGKDSLGDLSPRQLDDLLFAHTASAFSDGKGTRFDLDLSDIYPEMTPDDFRLLSPRQQRMLLEPVRGGAIGTNTWAAAGLTTSITTYSIGDILGTEVTVTTCAISAGKSGTILSAGVFDFAKVTGAINAFVANAALAGVGADNAAWTITDVAGSIVGMIPFPTPYASALNSYAEVTNLGLSYTTTTTTSSLFMDHVTLTANAVFGAATDLKYMMAILFD